MAKYHDNYRRKPRQKPVLRRASAQSMAVIRGRQPAPYASPSSARSAVRVSRSALNVATFVNSLTSLGIRGVGFFDVAQDVRRAPDILFRFVVGWIFDAVGEIDKAVCESGESMVCRWCHCRPILGWLAVVSSAGCFSRLAGPLVPSEGDRFLVPFLRCQHNP
jgi:hypothetical protein